MTLRKAERYGALGQTARWELIMGARRLSSLFLAAACLLAAGAAVYSLFTQRSGSEVKAAAAIEATGRKKLIFAGISLEVCAAFPAITALGKGYDAYVAVDASGTFSETKRQAGLLRMQQAGVILSDYATLMVEILKDNASPLAGPVYGALDMPWATLVGQIAKAYGK